jgi:2'-5' RNA ligase
MRSFLALILPEPVTGALAALQARLPAGRAVARDSLHLTLAFLGDQEESVLADLDGELGVVVAPRFDLTISGLGLLGGPNPKLIHAAVSPDPALIELRARIVTATRRAGITLAREKYRPHVTLARFGAGARGADLARLGEFLDNHSGFSLPPEPVSEFALFESILRPQGVLHRELARYRLG